MTRQANPMRITARNGLAYIENKIHSANRILKEVEELDNQLIGTNFDPSKVTQCKQKKKADANVKS